jgi:pimeloyl-ACP methyl ester carboxylesterase
MSGAGAPIVKAANWQSHLEFDGSSPVWLHLLRELSRNHTLVRYDARGSGLSDWNADVSFDAWVRDLEKVVEASGSERFPLLGISQGASIAIAYTLRRPERVSHLIIHGGCARGRSKWEGTAHREAGETMIKLAELGRGQQNPAFRQCFTTQFIPDGTPEQHQWWGIGPTGSRARV